MLAGVHQLLRGLQRWYGAEDQQTGEPEVKAPGSERKTLDGHGMSQRAKRGEFEAKDGVDHRKAQGTHAPHQQGM